MKKERDWVVIAMLVPTVLLGAAIFFMVFFMVIVTIHDMVSSL